MRRPGTIFLVLVAAALVRPLPVCAAKAKKAAPPARKAPGAPKKKAPGKGAPPAALAFASPALDAFLDRLTELERGDPGAPSLVRVLHFGDSHVAADYWSGELRRLFQERFGDAGPGHVFPGRPWRYFRHARARSLAAAGWETAGLGSGLQDGVYGLSGVGLVPLGEAEPAALEASFSDFEVQLALFADGECATVAVDGDTFFAGTPDDPAALECADVDVEPVEGSGVRLVRIRPREPLAEVPHRLEVGDGCGGAARLLGSDLWSGRPGVVWDALGVNGAELGALRKWDPSVRRLLLSLSDPALLVVSYGTNDLGRSDLTYEGYRADAVALLSSLKADAPGASVLVTGPIDRGSRSRKRRRSLAANEALLIRALREAARETGCAFWDARAAMGGDGSISRWASRGLAQRDLVHLTGKGYGELARLLHSRLMEASAARRGAGPVSTARGARAP